jgi:hypothetical protein
VGAVRNAAAAALVAAAAVAGVLVLAHGGSAPALAPTAPVAVRASFEPAVVQFGDPVVAHVVVTLDRDAVRAGTLHVEDDLAPLTALAAARTTRTVAGRLETVSITQRVACLTEPCLGRTIALPRVHLSVRTRSGSVTTLTDPWRRLQVRNRVTSADLARTSPRFAADTAPAAPSYRVAPGTAATVLDVVAALAAAGAVALLALQALAVVRRRQRAVTGDELARALRLVREAGARPVPDRRRALALLARLLPSTLGRRASDLAWSEPTPEPQDLDAFATRVERERAG